MQKNKLLFPKDPGSAKTPWLWIGTWSMGGEGFGSHDERESLKVLHAAAENDVRHFDTAGFYAHGKSERLLQQIIKTGRSEFFISSKGGLVWNGREVRHSASPEELKRQLFETLDRLNTDYLDLYQLHWPDPQVPLGESIGALKTFRDLGLVRYWGVGNLTAQQVTETLKYEKHVPHQVHFNPVCRTQSILQAGEDRCINCIISPLEQGLLGTGKSSSGITGIGKKDLRRKNPFFSNPEALKWTGEFNRLLELHQEPRVSVVLMWTCSRPHVHAIIPGPRKLEQLNEIIAFRADVEDNDLLAAGDDAGILSDEKVRKTVPEEIWRHLDRGPDKTIKDNI
ncbi:MAG: aldo/keto reductase [Nitrospirota bacterium]